MAEVAERLRSRGFGVYIVPEAATVLFTGGANVGKGSDDQVQNFQAQLLRTQLALEDAFVNIARKSSLKETFILCDRGTCDGRAYMTADLWNRMLEQNGWDMVSIRDARYDMVIHLVTAADGASEHYTLENNEVRTETSELACAVDRRTQAAWVGHPHLRIVDNRTNFLEKMNRVDARVSELAGLHLVRRTVRKFLLHQVQDNMHTSPDPCESFAVEQFVVEQTFLRTGLAAEVQESVRRRGKNGVYTYVHKVRRGDSREAETKRQITSREYTSLLPHRDPERNAVLIRRQCFLFKGTYFVLDCVLNVNAQVSLLRCHCEDGDDSMQIPPWVTIDTEVTGDRKYSIHSLALHAVANRDNSESTTTKLQHVEH